MIDKEMNSALLRGGPVRPLPNYQSMEPRSPHSAWQFGPAQPVKQEPMEEDKNDSGVTSGSEFHSSSPGSDTSQDLHRFYPAFYPHHPLTPPSSEPLVSPKSEKEEEPKEDHLRRLEMSLEKSGLFSSKTSEHSEKSDTEEFEEASLRVPKVNSHGKIKTFKCKQCDFVAITKLEQWNHSKVHIREEKRLTCPKCPFITEYKHHLEYHLRNHAGSKPFQCSKCDYSCVNKSMLNSHMKSHSNVYRYSCRDCSYATKYCHSLKIHLRRYSHRPNVVLDEEGNPCPDIIIDVHGTRRGPKVKSQQKEEAAKPDVVPFPFPAYPFFGGFPNAQLLQQLIRERQALVAAPPPPEESKVLDLSKPGCSYEQKSRRKGPAFRVDPSAAAESEEEEEEEASTTMFSNVEVVQQQQEGEEKDDNNNKGEDNCGSKGEDNCCQYCNIAFGDAVLHSIHMGYHGFHNPFTCNMCGAECADKVAFFLHIARVSHS